MLPEISKEGGVGLCTPIDILPDDALLEIFNHHRLASDDLIWPEGLSEWKWHRLAHVCRRWRTVIFSSSRHLKLQLVYTYKKPVRKNLDCWPDLPLSIRYRTLRHSVYVLSHTEEENLIAALEHSGRVCELNIDLDLGAQLSEKLIPMMRHPFPMLETLGIMSQYPLLLPSTFLGGSAPRLRRIHMEGTAFPTLPQFLVTAPALVSIKLVAWHNMGYFSPEALVRGLDAKPKLKVLDINRHISSSDQRSPRSPYPETRVALPALTELRIQADSEYLEDLISRIDAPNVEQLFATFIDHRTFDFPRLSEFISRTKHLTSPHRMSIGLSDRFFTIKYFYGPHSHRTFEQYFSCERSTGQMKSLIHACGQLSLLLSNVERLDIESRQEWQDWGDKPVTAQGLEWPEFFSLFGAVRALELEGNLIPYAASALEQSGNMGCRAMLASLRDLNITQFNPSAQQMESFLPLPQFLLSAPGLVSFRLSTSYAMGYFSPAALVAGLDAKPKLEILEIDCELPCIREQSSPSPYSQTRVALPALTEFRFRGDNTCLEGLITRIVSPNVERFFVTFLDRVTLDSPRLAEFISRIEHLMSPQRTSIRIRLSWDCFTITYYFALPFTGRIFELQIRCCKPTGYIIPLTHACTQLSLLLSNVERLDIDSGASKVPSDWRDKPDTVQWLEWLEFFSLFGAVRTLELIGDLIPFAASALEQSSNMGYRAVLPFLQDLHMRCLDSSAPQMDSFLASRRRCGRVVSIHYAGRP